MSFDHREPGTAEEAWAASAPWADQPCLPLDDVDRLVVLAAHPDDETLGAGGLLSRMASRGVPVTVLIATDGEASHPHSPTYDAPRLAALRRDETRAALACTAPRAELTFFGIPDGGLREHRHELRARLTDAVGSASGSDTGRTLLVAPWAGDGHRDHRIAGEVASEVATNTGVRLLEYPIWLWHWGTPTSTEIPWQRMLRLELTVDERAAKRRGLTAHRSQIAPLSDAPGDETMLGTEMQRHFERDVEVFVRPAGSLGERFFDDFYDGKSDPWGFETRWYEERKRAITLACLPRERFASGLEVGCSTGVLTQGLAGRCDRLLAIDIADAPLERARSRLGRHPQVGFAKMATPAQWPDGDFVHDRIRRRTELSRTVQHIEEDFVLEVFARPPALSVARASGVI